jgi:hypothetical protein
MKLLYRRLIWASFALATARAETVSPLFARGYTVMPEPQVVRLGALDFAFGADWKVETRGVQSNDVALETLREELGQRCHLQLSESGSKTLLLTLSPHAVSVGSAQDRDREVLAQQAYKIDLSPAAITIAANAPTGLFYGVVTLVQLLKPVDGVWMLPAGHIEDWPDLQLRQIYWDDAHHLDRMNTLKHALRQAAFFKINGFALKLEGHFQFKSASAMVEPNALMPAEYQELTDYGLHYHVQLIPYLDAPSHIAFILKHPEYAKLREFPESNYEACVTNPDYYSLMFGMFQDLLDANKGVKYFYLSTDEAYYIGLADNPQCREAQRAKELGSVGRLLGEFVTKAAAYLHDRGRTVVFWGEYPMKADDIPSLPTYVVNGEVYGPRFDPEFRKHGIREMIYTSTQGMEPLFPEYFALPASRRLHGGRSGGERVADTFYKISFDSARHDADLMGSINAGWADTGLHPETFWLGYAAYASAAWRPGSSDPAETTSTFYPLYYGRRVAGMNRIYELMSTQAQSWDDSWDGGPSKFRKGIWGNSEHIWETRHPAHDYTLPLPPTPGPDLSYKSEWSNENAKRIQLAAESLRENNELLGLLHENLPRADLNAYNLEVFLSIAHLYRHNLEMLHDISRIDRHLRAAADAAVKDQHTEALEMADQALEVARRIQYSRNRVLADAIATWYKAWYPRVAEANGRRFLHELDDVKDHPPDRTVDMSYLVYREAMLPFGEWVEQIRAMRNQYAQAHNLPLNNAPFDWKDLKPVYGGAVSAIALE